MTTTSLQTNYLNTVTVGGRNLGVFDRFSGGNRTSTNTKRRHGGSIRKKVHPSYGEFDTVTVGRDYDLAAMHAEVRRMLTTETPLPMVVRRQPLDAERRPFGDSLIYQGFVETVSPGDIDADAEDLTDIEITMTVGSVQ